MREGLGAGGCQATREQPRANQDGKGPSQGEPERLGRVPRAPGDARRHAKAS
jgi:hypothetical protein